MIGNVSAGLPAENLVDAELDELLQLARQRDGEDGELQGWPGRRIWMRHAKT